VGIEWPLAPEDLIISERDANAPRLAEVADELPFEWHP
jgi:dTDP-4-dehydrorhamnose 3,5-epimerase-like enzyme